MNSSFWTDKIDCYIGSDYFCDWIIQNNKKWEDKVTRFGYPRMDRIYSEITGNTQIPKEWSERTSGKTVIFSALYNITPYLELFPKENSDRVLIWRSHPLELRNKDYIERIKKYEAEYAVILDFLSGYYAACSVSDAMISDVGVSLNLNYLYYGKPLMLVVKDKQIGDYEEQAWYKACYRAFGKDEVESFIEMVEEGEDFEKEKLLPYREYMTRGFDGHVCDRIFDYVENTLNAGGDMNKTDKPIIIFGAGMHGLQALKMIGEEKVAYFLDNNAARHGSFYHGKKIVGFDDIMDGRDKYHFVIASQYVSSMKQDLKSHGIEDFEVFRNYLFSYYETEELIFNPYESIHEAENEDDWNNSEKLKYSRKEVYEEVEELYGKEQLFNHIEIETINRCNGVCEFCPVNKNVDPRTETIMSEELFKKIVAQLEEMDYSGKFTTFSNNEPLLDERIVEFNRYAREHLPKARMHLFTNGTLLTLDKFIALTEVLDELIIDNYQQELKLIKPCAEIAAYCEEHQELKKKVTIVLRKPREILTSRGGNAPNRKDVKEYPDDRCVLPFKQMIVRPDGKVSLCCNDATGQYTLGDLNEESIRDVWFGTKFSKARQALYKGRKYCGNCKLCDTFTGG